MSEGLERRYTKLTETRYGGLLIPQTQNHLLAFQQECHKFPRSFECL